MRKYSKTTQLMFDLDKNEMLMEMMRATCYEMNGKKKEKIEINKFTDFPKKILKKLKEQQITEEIVNDETKLHLLCRIISHKQKYEFICKKKVKSCKKDEKHNTPQANRRRSSISIHNIEKKEFLSKEKNFIVKKNNFMRNSKNDNQQVEDWNKLPNGVWG